MNACDRFLRYVAFDTTSDEDSATVPSTEKQKRLGKFLAEELAAIGLADAHMDACGYVYGTLPATPGSEDAPAVGLIAHMDTSPAVSGTGVKASVVRYTGGDLRLENGLTLSPAEFPALSRYAGEDLIVTDGRTLLGADDKAGISEIFTMLEYFASHPEVRHARIPVCITPDEEIGRGADHFDLAKFHADFAYTVDGGELGEIEYENFNAASAKIRINGINIHPGDAKNKMKNATLLAAELISMLPAAQTPAHTEGYEGFYHVTGIAGNESLTEVQLIIRDHDRAKFEGRKAFIEHLTAYLNGVYGEGTFDLTLRDSYYNMKEKILPHMHLIERATAAMQACGVEPKIVPIRGGTDGARLSYEGLPCPNLCTGGANYHSVREYIPVFALEKMVEILVVLLSLH